MSLKIREKRTRLVLIGAGAVVCSVDCGEEVVDIMVAVCVFLVCFGGSGEGFGLRARQGSYFWRTKISNA